MAAVRRGELQLSLTNQPPKGDSYPSVHFRLAPADFELFLQAGADTTKALEKK